MQLLRSLFLFALLLVGLPLTAQQGAVEGRVMNVRNHAPLVGVLVQLEDRPGAVLTDSAGHYALRQVTPGFYHLTLSLLGFEKKHTLELQVLGHETTFFDVEMEESDVLLTEAVVKPNVQETRAESPLSVRTLEVQQIEKSAGVNSCRLCPVWPLRLPIATTSW